MEELLEKEKTDKIDKISHPVDVHVGKRLRMRRTYLGITQEKMGELVGITFQQIQKYEKGTNRIGSSRMYEFARVLDIPVSYFFEDFNIDDVEYGFNDKINYAAEDDNKFSQQVLHNKESMELLRAYYQIEDVSVRKKMLELMKTFSESGKKKSKPRKAVL